MSRKREQDEDKHCKCLKYAEIVTRVLDERYFDDIADAVYNNKKGIFLKICKGPLGMPEPLADDLWSRIKLATGPAEYW